MEEMVVLDIEGLVESRKQMDQKENRRFEVGNPVKFNQ